MSSRYPLTRVKDHPGVYSYEVKLGPPSRRKRYAAVASYLDRQRWTSGHRTIGEAERARDELRQQLRGGAMRADARLTLEEWFNRWLPTLDVKASTARTYRVQADNITARIGHLRLSQITERHIEDFKGAMREEGLHPTWRNKLFVRLGHALEAARKQKLIANNPCRDVAPPRIERHRPPVLDLDAIRRVLDAADAEGYGLLIWLIMDTGLRSTSEAFALRWEDIDFGSRLLRVPQAKTDAGERAVKLGPESLRRLREHRVEQMARYVELGASPPPLVFVNTMGRPLRQPTFWLVWDRIRRTAGLDGLHIHDLRHVHTTILARQGVHPAVAQARLGHANSRMTLDVYTHTTADMQEGAAIALEEALGIS